jgi:TonB family protein
MNFKTRAALIVGIVFILTAALAPTGLSQTKAAGGAGLAPKYEKWLAEEVCYIITDKEKDVFLKLATDKERDVFMESFWKQRDPNPATPQNEFKEEHYRRLTYANTHFRTETTPGWKTGAGRAYIVMGDALKPVGWAMKMRLIEGVRTGSSERAKTVTSSYLNYSLTANLKTEVGMAEELTQIRKTFNYEDVKLLTEADFHWLKAKPEQQFHIFRLDGHEYLVLITPVDIIQKLVFRIEVFEQAETSKKSLLDTEFAIPEKNATVFGFEDSKGSIYFLSFLILGWLGEADVQGAPVRITLPDRPPAFPGQGPLRAIGDIKPPRLIRQVDPVYPKDADKAGIEGVVILEATTDVYGRVQNVRVLRSIPMLDKAAIDAVKQWIYEPMIIEGRPRGIVFTVTVRFQKKDKTATTEAAKRDGAVRITAAAAAPKIIKMVDPVYPEIARTARVEGTVILEATIDIYGRIQNVKVLRSIPLLDQAAIDAVRQWVYEPAVIDGKPQSVSFTVTVVFTLHKNKPQVGGVAGGVAGGVEGGVQGGVEGGVAGGIIGQDELPAVKVEADIEPPRLIKRVDPAYPEDARVQGIEGTVILEAETDIYGRVKRLKVLRSIPELDQAAIDAVKQLVYEPMIREGKSRGAIFTVTVAFRLK